MLQSFWAILLIIFLIEMAPRPRRPQIQHFELIFQHFPYVRKKWCIDLFCVGLKGVLAPRDSRIPNARTHTRRCGTDWALPNIRTSNCQHLWNSQVLDFTFKFFFVVLGLLGILFWCRLHYVQTNCQKHEKNRHATKRKIILISRR